jgi:Eco29kI restriction endonuclease
MPDDTHTPFNPLDKRNLAESIAIAIERSPVQPLAPSPFKAAGLYFLYYSGSFDAYAPLAKVNVGAYHWPIYIGKGMPPGVRKGAVDESKKGRQAWGIYDRLYNHEKSIAQVANLEVKDFLCRWLSMDEAFIHLGETLLITKYRPVWNVAVEGFGNKVVGKGRDKAQRSNWDTLHPGRGGAAGGAGRKSLDQIRAHITAHFKETLPD